MRRPRLTPVRSYLRAFAGYNPAAESIRPFPQNIPSERGLEPQLYHPSSLQTLLHEYHA
jgi:hypothetical protein